MRLEDNAREHPQDKFARIFVIIFLILNVTGLALTSLPSKWVPNIFGKAKPLELKEQSISSNNSISNYHVNKNFKYEYRTETSGNYEYNYAVDGTDDEGNNVSGDIYIRGKNGSGTIEDENGNEKEIDVEWIGYGALEGTDDDGNIYELEVN